MERSADLEAAVLAWGLRPQGPEPGLRGLRDFAPFIILTLSFHPLFITLSFSGNLWPKAWSLGRGSRGGPELGAACGLRSGARGLEAVGSLSLEREA